VIEIDSTGVRTAPPGVVIGTVQDVDDPLAWGRVRVRFDWLQGYTVSNWAPIASVMAGPDYGVWFIPEVGDMAVVAFERGDVNLPVVLGFIWGGDDKRPSASTHERMIRTVNGHTIRFLDSTPTSGGNRGAVAIEDGHGNQIVMSNRQVTIRANGTLVLDGATVAIRSMGVTRVVSPTPNSI
jgi:uncharacterized protein involved in type VI secretion and phage assembly